VARAADAVILVAETEGVAVGTVMTGYDGHRGWMYYLATDPAQRRRGIARRLVAEAESWLAARGCPKAQLMVRHGNESALRFYESLGYEEQAVRVLGRWLIDPPSPPGSAVRRGQGGQAQAAGGSNA
jgi:ribosomal protein S18 acetylase RimI-like enzyme